MDHSHFPMLLGPVAVSFVAALYARMGENRITKKQTIIPYLVDFFILHISRAT